MRSGAMAVCQFGEGLTCARLDLQHLQHAFAQAGLALLYRTAKAPGTPGHLVGAVYYC